MRGHHRVDNHNAGERTSLGNEALVEGAAASTLVGRSDEAHLETRLVDDLPAEVRRAARRSKGYR